LLKIVDNFTILKSPLLLFTFRLDFKDGQFGVGKSGLKQSNTHYQQQQNSRQTGGLSAALVNPMCNQISEDVKAAGD
jgi:hypothetical protein